MLEASSDVALMFPKTIRLSLQVREIALLLDLMSWHFVRQLPGLKDK
jgi:hypothetical protein